MIRRPPRSTLFPTRRSSDLGAEFHSGGDVGAALDEGIPDAGSVSEDVDELFNPNRIDRKSTRLNSSHLGISYAVFCLKKKKNSRSTKETCNTRTDIL